MEIVNLNLYHGSHALFSKFDMAKIGTGEGEHSEGVGMCLTTDFKYAKKSADYAAFKNGIKLRHVYEVTVAVEETKFWDTSLKLNDMTSDMRNKLEMVSSLVARGSHVFDVENLDNQSLSIAVGKTSSEALKKSYNEISINMSSHKTEDFYRAMLLHLEKWNVFFLLRAIGIDLVKVDHKYVVTSAEILKIQTHDTFDF
jgi:hypothetical protein